MTLSLLNAILVSGLAATVCAYLAYHAGKQDGRRENAATVAEMLRESRERDAKLAAMLAEVERLRAKRLQGRA